jgi:hypothetical protein
MTKAAVIKVTEEDLEEMRKARESEYRAHIEFLWKKFRYLLQAKIQTAKEN